jgi:nitric oxide reductase activation protein
VVPGGILAESLVKLRTVLADNRAGRRETNLRHGRRIDGKVLARKWADGDASFFARRSFPAKKDYFVVLGVDVSGSTMGWLPSKDSRRRDVSIIQTIKLAVFAQAELLARLGIRFAIYAHSGSWGGDGINVEIFEVKTPNDPWNGKTKQALMDLGPYSANLDGHTLEFYRKAAMADHATDRVIMYYTDGAMPCENYDEELVLLEENIKLCKAHGVSLLAVGVGNDEPKGYGLPTVRLDGVEDVPEVVKFLGQRLAE